MALVAFEAGAQTKEVEIGLIAPMSGPWARQGQVMKLAADLAIETINQQGGIKSLGGAKLKLSVFDAGDSVEKAKNAAQRMVADSPNLVGATGAYLSSFTLAVTEVTERAQLPVMTFSYSDLITSRGFKYVFQTSATGDQQAEGSLPALHGHGREGVGQAAEDHRHRHGQHRRVGGVREADEGPSARQARPDAGGGRDLHAAAGERDAADPASALGAAGHPAAAAHGHLGREAAAGEDERVRARARQDCRPSPMAPRSWIRICAPT